MFSNTTKPARFGLVNKRLVNIVKPELYERYSFDRGHPELFLHSLVASPELGTLIQTCYQSGNSVKTN
jgi:hypothetical protein